MRAGLQYPFPTRTDARPLCIAHRGAPLYAPEASAQGYAFAADLGSEMWEVDIHLTGDRVPVACHDAVVGDLRIADCARADLVGFMDLDQLVRHARARGQGLYLDLKAQGSGLPCLEILSKHGFEPAVLGAFDDDEARALIAAQSPWPVSVLVRPGEDPFARAEATQADIIHLCWEHASARPQDLVTPELIAEAQRRGLGLALWHEERPEVLRDLLSLPALGICTNQPELIGGFESLGDHGIEVVCHRGINHIAPENTLAGARLTYDMGCDWLELDVRTTRDGEIVVLHDATLDRTTNGNGPILAKDWADIADLDAGSWKSAHWQDERLPRLAEMIDLAKARGRRIYIENKAVPARQLLEFVEARDFLQDCFFWSPDPTLLREMRQLSPQANIKSNIIHHVSFNTMVDELSPQICEIQVADWEVEAPLCRAHGIRPMLQFFGEDPAVFARIAEWRPEMVNLDRADLLLAALKAAL
ncbi:glycerophosphodiester phosphodiesterase [Allosediminivita pacifica]|uniref:Glycerophosphoryl diester phosphodiesterase n=1 Tax=Allosediminivita pacifica TaxID=1267769 RepID=A0A2T6A4E8_9RHOB|nr:glycerophosphodiester phosphodiesterase family protein [Allosediminivita pacifica]PTX38680.1 glycerophosphoryl diester phosphodiesterase [Allosediminivita pacifica]GGB28852.1 hypothetical protein GCM10011324_43090 [Allosediminivita pacifica]